MVTPARTWPAVLVGVAVVVVGVLVLRSPGAQAEVGWFAYGPPPAELLDGLLAWNPTRAVGAGLVVLGLLVLAHRLGVLLRSRGLAPTGLGARVLVLAGLLVVGGLVAFVVLRAADRRGATVAISRVVPQQQVAYGSTAWTPDQTAAALVVATGLVVAAVGLGLRRRRAS